MLEYIRIANHKFLFLFLFLFFKFFDNMEPYQGSPLEPPPGSKPWIHNPTRQNRVSGNLG